MCQRPLEVSYWSLAGHAICSSCRDAIVKGPETAPMERFGRALVAGIGASFAGFLIYWGILAATGYEIGIIAIVVGMMVGGAVRWGAQRRGGWLYQGMAIYLTYLSIVASYIAGAVMSEGLPPGNPLVVGIGLVIVAHAAPFLAGLSNVIGILIIGIALYQAWKMNQSVLGFVTGPFPVGAPAPNG